MLLAYEPPSHGEAEEHLATVDISAKDKELNTPLHLAAQGGHCSVAVKLISKGASVRARLAALCCLASYPCTARCFLKIEVTLECKVSKFLI